MKESMKQRFGSSAAVTAAALPAIPMILVMMPEEWGKELPLLDLHESFV